MIQGRWKLLILRELEADGVVVRTVHAQVPPRVDHALSHLGQELMPLLESLNAFGEQVGRDR